MAIDAQCMFMFTMCIRYKDINTKRVVTLKMNTERSRNKLLRKQNDKRTLTTAKQTNNSYLQQIAHTRARTHTHTHTHTDILIFI